MRARSDDELAALIRARPDLVIPAPGDSTVFAMRVADRTHVARALDELDRFHLAVIDAILLLGAEADVETISTHLGSNAAPALDRLRELALVWDAPELRPVNGLPAAVERPAGLGRPVAALLRRLDRATTAGLLAANGLAAGGDADEAATKLARALPAAVASASPEERDVLDRVDAGGGVGAVARAFAPADPADPSPVRRLLARGLLIPLDVETVELPREVGLTLRGDNWLPPVPADPPPLTATGTSRGDANAAGALVAAEFVRLVGLVLEEWAIRPPSELKSGGLGQRDLKGLARLLSVDEAQAALVIEVIRAAGLVGRTTSLDARFAPTQEYDIWARNDVGKAWTELAASWLNAASDAGTVGTRDDRDRVQAALAPQTYLPAARDLRLSVLRALATAEPGSAPTRESLLERLVWLRPRRVRLLRGHGIDSVLHEADALGVTLGGALTSFGRAILDGNEKTCAAILSAALPPPVDHLLLQADLTAIAPGPLAPELAADVALLADIESPGSATVYRFSEASLRRALDTGWDTAAIQALLTRIGRPAVPQTLSYLVDDTGRRHGRLRVGTAGAYVRCDDEALLASVVADRRCAALQLRLIAPTVMISGLAVSALIDGLRAAGYAPAAERTDGTIVLGRPEGVRAARAMSTPTPDRAPNPTDSARIVAGIRAGDRVALTTPRSGEQPERGIQDMLALIEQAIAETRPIVLGYINAQGQDSRRLVDPERVSGGLLTAYDHRTQERRSFALHRITELDFADESGA